MTMMATVLTMSVVFPAVTGVIGVFTGGAAWSPLALLLAKKAWLPLVFEVGMVLAGLAIAIPIPYLEKIKWEGRASK